jgi:hypothetical protein
MRGNGSSLRKNDTAPVAGNNAAAVIGHFQRLALAI